jgi:hypothetical protein
MPRVKVKGVANPIDFPDDMDIQDIKAFLQKRFANMATTGQSTVDVNPIQATAQASNLSLVDKAAQGVGNALTSSGLVSDNFGAQQIGRNITSAGEFLPVLGDAAAGDEFGKALAGGDGVGMALGALGAIPLVGDAAKKGARKVFHGSDRQIDEYRRGTNPKGRLGAGIYFGNEKKANVFAKIAKIKKQPSFLNQAEIVSNNPKKVTEDMLLLYPQGKFPSEIFEREGYTGIQLINENNGDIIEETVFDPKNIRSLNPSTD